MASRAAEHCSLLSGWSSANELARFGVSSVRDRDRDGDGKGEPERRASESEMEIENELDRELRMRFPHHQQSAANACAQ